MINKFQTGGATPQQLTNPELDKVFSFIESQPEQAMSALMEQGNVTAEQIAQVVAVGVKQGKISQASAQKAIQVLQALASRGGRKLKLGAKLNYIRSLKNECPEGQDVAYFKEGGRVCKKCIERAAGGEKVKDGKKEIADFKKKKACGGSKMKFQPGGKAPKQEKAKHEVKEKCGGKVKKHQFGGSLNGIPFYQEGGKSKKKSINDYYLTDYSEPNILQKAKLNGKELTIKVNKGLQKGEDPITIRGNNYYLKGDSTLVKNDSIPYSFLQLRNAGINKKYNGGSLNRTPFYQHGRRIMLGKTGTPNDPYTPTVDEALLLTAIHSLGNEEQYTRPVTNFEDFLVSGLKLPKRPVKKFFDTDYEVGQTLKPIFTLPQKTDNSNTFINLLLSAARKLAGSDIKKETKQQNKRTAPKAEVRYANSSREPNAKYAWYPALKVVLNTETGIMGGGMLPASITRYVQDEGDTVYVETPEAKLYMFRPTIRYDRTASTKNPKGQEYDILKRRFNTAWNIAK